MPTPLEGGCGRVLVPGVRCRHLRVSCCDFSPQEVRGCHQIVRRAVPEQRLAVFFEKAIPIHRSRLHAVCDRSRDVAARSIFAAASRTARRRRWRTADRSTPSCVRPLRWPRSARPRRAQDCGPSVVGNRAGCDQDSRPLCRRSRTRLGSPFGSPSRWNTRAMIRPSCFRRSCSTRCSCSVRSSSAVNGNVRPSRFLVEPGSRRTTRLSQSTCRHSSATRA